MSLSRLALSGGGGALTPASEPTAFSLDDSLIVMVGASNVEGNAGATPCDYLLDYAPFDTNGASVSNQGHGAHSFAWGDHPLTSSLDTDPVQALQGTAVGPEVLVIVGDPAVNEYIQSDGARSPSDVLSSWQTLVDFYRANGWHPDQGRRLVIANCLDASESEWGGTGDVEAWNALVADQWSIRADLLIDVHSIVPGLVDGIHMTEQNARDMAQLIATALATLEE